MHARPVVCPSLIGRDRELELLHAARRALAKSHSAFVLIGGESGIGKSRLLAQFLRATSEGRARTIVSAECLEHAPQPFGPVRDAIAALARTTGSALPPLLARFVTRETTGEAIEKADLFAAVTEFLRERALNRATIVTFEDLHWSDATTLEYLGYVASRLAGSRLLLVATYRSDEAESNDALSATIARAMREPTTFRLDLHALTSAQLRTLLHGALDGHDPLDRRMLDDIVTRADGNPFFGEELLKSALENTGNAGRTNIPISIRASIIERLRSFSADERLVIDRAAVLGLRFDPYVLARTMDAPIEAVLPALRRARDANIVVEEDGERVRFRFRHALTRQAVYDNLLLFDARRTHRTILETLEAFDAEGEHIEELAYHAWEARDLAKARRYNEMAGERAFALFALPEARVCFQRALESDPPRKDEARVLERLGRTTSMLGNLPSAIELYESAIAAYIALEDFERAAVLVAWSAADRNNLGDASSVAFGTAFLERYGRRVPVTPRDQLVAMLARLAIISFDVDRCAVLLGQIEAPDALSEAALHNVLLARSEMASATGDARGWADAATRLLDVLPTLSTFTQVTAGYTVAQAASYFGRDDLVDRAFVIVNRIESRVEIAVLRSYGEAIRALDHFMRGNVDGAGDALRRAIDVPDLHVSDSVLACFAPYIVDALDDDTLFPPRLEDQFADVRLRARHGDDVAILGGSATWLLRHDRRREALADVRLGVSCLTQPLPNCHALLAIAAQHFDLDELHRLAPFLDADALASDDRLGRAHAHALGAIVARRSGEMTRATELAMAAARTYELLGRPLLQARALDTAGRTADARAMYVRHGAVGYAKRLGSTTDREPSHDVLSEREREVATFVAAGLGNAAIAERLSISKKTVEKHIGSIYDKLGIRSRAQLAGLLARANGLQASARG